MIRDRNKIPELLNSLPKEKERILRKAGAFLEGAVKEKITQGDPSWPPLRPETVKRKGSSKPLIDTGKLRTSITHKVEEDKALIGIFSGEALNYAAVHEFGSPKRNIPERSYLRKTFDEKRNEIEKLIDAEIEKVLRRYSFHA
jgi:phage gpG-like protein